MNNHKAVITCIFGGRDELQEPQFKNPDIDYICWTDNVHLKSDVWDLRYVSAIDPRLATKEYKIRSHLHTKKYELTLWLDASFSILDLGSVFSALDTCNPNRKPFLGLTRHPQRSCIYKEAARARRARKDHPVRLERVLAEYQEEGHPANWGLFRGGLILRRACDANAQFGEAWHEAVINGSHRDQLSLPVILRRHEIDFNIIHRGVPHVRLRSHTGKVRSPKLTARN